MSQDGDNWATTSLVLEQLRDFDDGAWSEFCGRFRAPLVRLPRNMALPESEAEDVAQESLLTFATTFREGRYDRARGRLRSWLFGIAYRRVLKSRQRLARDRDREGAAASSLWSKIPDADAARITWTRSWRESVMQQCLQRVEQEVQPKTWSAFRRVVFDRAEPSVVAAELDMSQNSVALAKHRVLKRLRELRRYHDDLVTE